MKRFLIMAGIVAMFTGCYNDKYSDLYPPVVNPCDTTTITYSNDIKPIIATGFFSPRNGCHDAVGGASSGYDFETNIGPLQAVAANGKLLGSVHWDPGFSQMPKNAPKLSDCEINKIERWVHLGAPNN